MINAAATGIPTIGLMKPMRISETGKPRTSGDSAAETVLATAFASWNARMV